MKKKLFYLSIIFFAIILLLLLGTTKVNADGERIGDWDVLFVDEEGSVYYDYESLDSSIHEYKWSLINEYHGNETNLTIHLTPVDVCDSQAAEIFAVVADTPSIE